jgi:hypothetical protein
MNVRNLINGWRKLQKTNLCYLQRYVCCNMGGYEQTKFVAERLVEQAIKERGLRGSIFRLGLVAWNTQTGMFIIHGKYIT